jgi:putative ABC transport system substrate-binding protein
VFAAGNSLAAAAAKAASSTIPIVFVTGGDPVEDGLVASLNLPGGNATGVTISNLALTAKRLGLLHEFVPAAARFANLVNPRNPRGFASEVADATAAVASIGRQIEIFKAGDNNEIDAAFAKIVQWRADALLIGTGTLFLGRGARQLAALTLRHGLPAIGYAREYVEAGGLMSYGSIVTEVNRQAGIYVGRVLKGEKPAELPVMRPTKFELVINLTTARTIGLDVPPNMLAIADDVIE